jgi:uncharacterized protein (TIRG00374 family)
MSVLLAAFFLYLALRGLNWTAFLASLRLANYGYVAFLAVWSSASYFLRAMRWRVLLNSQKYIPPLNVFWANMAGYLGNNVLPARAGEFVRAAYVSQKENIPIAFVFATGLAERLADLAALVILGAASIFFTEAVPGYMQGALRNFAFVAILGIAFIFSLPLLQSPVNKILGALPFLSQPLKSKLRELANHFVEGIKVIARIERWLPFALFTALIWLMDGVGVTVLALALHEKLTLAQAFLFIAALGLSSAVPSTPGFVGVYQFVAVTVLVPFGIVRESALALILISQALNLLIVSCWGGLGLWNASRNMPE